MNDGVNRMLEYETKFTDDVLVLKSRMLSAYSPVVMTDPHN